MNHLKTILFSSLLILFMGLGGVTAQSSCDAPTGVKFSNVTSTTMTAECDVAPGTTDYTFTYWTDASTATIVTSSTPSVSFARKIGDFHHIEVWRNCDGSYSLPKLGPTLASIEIVYQLYNECLPTYTGDPMATRTIPNLPAPYGSLDYLISCLCDYFATSENQTNHNGEDFMEFHLPTVACCAVSPPAGLCESTSGGGGGSAIPESDKSFHTQHVSLSPNPFSQFIGVQFETENNTDYNIRMIGLDGKVHSSWTNSILKGHTSLTLETANLSPGLYLIEVRIGERIETFRLNKL